MEGFSVDDAQRQFSYIIDRVEAHNAVIAITRDGVTAAVLVSAADYDSLNETLLWLSDPEHDAEMNEARADIAAGRMVSVDVVRRHLKILAEQTGG